MNHHLPTTLRFALRTLLALALATPGAIAPGLEATTPLADEPVAFALAPVVGEAASPAPAPDVSAGNASAHADQDDRGDATTSDPSPDAKVDDEDADTSSARDEAPEEPDAAGSQAEPAAEPDAGEGDEDAADDGSDDEGPDDGFSLGLPAWVPGGTNLSVPSWGADADHPGYVLEERAPTPVHSPGFDGLQACALDACENETVLESQTLYETEGLAGPNATTPGLEGGENCVEVVIRLACLSTPPLEEQTYETFDVPGTTLATPEATVEPVCALAQIVCVTWGAMPEEHVADVPGHDATPVTPQASVAVYVEGFELGADSHADEWTLVGPFTPVTVPVPGWGPFGLELCPDRCPVPVLPEGSLVGTVHVELVLDGETVYEGAFPVAL